MITLFSNGHPLSEIGVKSLKGYLENFNIPVRAIYMDQVGMPPQKIIDQVLELTAGSKLVGFSLMSKDVAEFRLIIDAVRKKQNIPVVLGGIHPTALPEESLQFCDFVCAGEGEEPLRLLYNAIKNKSDNFDIANIGYWKGNISIINPATYFIESLDDLPFPDYSFENSYYYCRVKNQIEKIPADPDEKGRYFGWDTLIYYSQRGCRFACTYCSNSLYHKMARACGKKWYRMASPERVKKELKHYFNIMPFLKKITYNDDDFLARNIEDLREIAEFIHDELHAPFSINAIPGYVTEEKIALLVKNGLTKIGFGVQSGSKRILREVFKRGQTNEQVLEAARIINKYGNGTFEGLYANYGFILDNPYENDDDWRDSLRLLISLPRPRTINLYSLTFFAGTELANRALADGHISTVALNFDKRYQDDLAYTYSNTLFYLNRAHLPLWLNNLLMSDFMVKSIITYPLRQIIKNRILMLALLDTAVMIKNAPKKIMSIAKKLTIKIARFTNDKIELSKNPLPRAANKAKRGWSVVVVTGGNAEESLSILIESVEKELDPEAEKRRENIKAAKQILERHLQAKILNSGKIALKHIPYYDTPGLPGLITRKKNVGVFAARYDKVAVCHDYVIFDPGWKDGYDKFGDDFEVCMNKIFNKDRSRYRDWVTWDYPGVGPAFLPYDKECTEYQYISGTYFVVKKDFYHKYPLNEKLRWGEGEDIEWSKRIRSKVKFKFNLYSSVSFSKQKDDAYRTWQENTSKLEIILG